MMAPLRGSLSGPHGLHISPPLNFCLWDFVKDEVYVVCSPLTPKNFKDQIEKKRQKMK
jgi:hypothetical protein